MDLSCLDGFCFSQEKNTSASDNRKVTFGTSMQSIWDGSYKQFSLLTLDSKIVSTSVQG